MRRLHWPWAFATLVATNIDRYSSMHLKGEEDVLDSDTREFDDALESLGSSIWMYLAHLASSSLGNMSFGESPFSDKLFKWADEALEPTNTYETSSWPLLETVGVPWDSGLRKPHLYVISMERSKKRRASFAQRFKNVGMNFAGLHWAPGVDGFTVPIGLVNPHGVNATNAELFFLHHPGVLGCYLSHMLVYRKHLKICPGCDMMIMEDDVDFHPQFRQRWQKFMSGVPNDMLVQTSAAKGQPTLPVARLHVGGDAFWERPEVETPDYYQVLAVSRTWGYVVRREFTKSLLDFLQRRNLRWNMGVDEQLSGRDFVSKFPVLAPKQPLIRALPARSHTGTDFELDKDHGVGQDPMLWHKSCWVAAYVHGQPCLPRE